MSHRFDGRVAIVTGAGGGLGYAYAEYLAAHGAKVDTISLNRAQAPKNPLAPEIHIDFL